LASEPPEAIGLRAGDLDCAIARKFGVIDVEDLIVEPLQRALGDGDEANRDVQIGQPECRLCQAFEMLQVFLDVFAAANAPKARDQPHRGIRFDHFDTLPDAAAHPRILSISRVTVPISSMPSTRPRMPRSS